MKWSCTPCLALAALAMCHGARLGDTPMAKVVSYLTDMNKRIEASGKAEQASYDKFSCWCEETLSSKAADITKGKQKIEDLENDIMKNKGLLGAAGATIGILNRDMTDNTKAQQEAMDVRNKEFAGYKEGATQSEQSIAAMEGAINVLSTAGLGKKGFLETLQEAKVLSVVAAMRPVMETDAAKKMKAADLEVVERFVSKPQEFFKNGGVSALQTKHNPFGDYAPGSTVIQGILKNLYDSFVADLEGSDVEEADRQKSFETLMTTKKKEYDTLETSLRAERKNQAERTRAVAVAKTNRDNAQEQLDADEKFFQQSKDNCALKAKTWAERSRLRTQEVAGIKQAIGIMNSAGAKKTFESATKFLQVSAVVNKHPRAEAYKRLKSLAARYQNLKLAQIAVAAKTTGHFDDVIGMVDNMVGVLREEEAEDIAHRDRCEGKENNNANNIADANNGIKKAGGEMSRLKGLMSDKKADIKEIEASMAKTQKTIDEVVGQRKAEAAEFAQATKDDTDSMELLVKAKAALAKFYASSSAMQVDATPTEKPAPHTTFDAEGGDYKGNTGDARNVMAMLDMLNEDIRKELKVGNQGELDAQVAYLNAYNSLKQIYRAANEARTAAKTELAVLMSDHQEASQDKDSNKKDLSDEMKLKAAIKTDCQWVGLQFEKRRKSRKDEIDGLAGAKDFLAGVGTDTDFSFAE